MRWWVIVDMRYFIAPTLGPTEKFGWEVQVNEGTHMTTHRGFAPTHAKALEAVNRYFGAESPEGHLRGESGDGPTAPEVADD